MNRYEKFISRIEEVVNNGQQGVFFISGPSAVGKDGLWRFIDRMNYEKLYNLVKPTSTTTRLPRIGEVCGEDYYYVYEEDIVNADGTFADHVINPIKFGQIKGRNIWYCYTKEEIDEHLKAGRSLIFLLLGSALDFYRDYINRNFPKVRCVATCWTISREAQREKFFRREPNKTKEELEKVLASREAERALYDKMIEEGKFDFVDDASIRLKDWKDEQIENHKVSKKDIKKMKEKMNKEDALDSDD